MTRRTHRKMNPCLGFSIVIALLATASASAFPGTYLPGAPFQLPNDVIVGSYSGPVIPFNRDVQDTVKGLNAGEIRFELSAWNRPGNPSPGGGAALSGGFFMDPMITLKPDFELHWIQTVARDTTVNGQNAWGHPELGNNAPFPDAFPADPIYPYEALLPGINPNPAPTLGFSDYPARLYSDGNQSWRGELGLTCVKNTPGPNGYREVRVIGTFLWGFEVSTFPNNVVTATGPGLWGIATNDYINTLREYYDGMAPGGMATGRYSFDNNSNCFRAVPEPVTALFLLIGAAAAAGSRRGQLATA